jgi:hypothetical protein
MTSRRTRRMVEVSLIEDLELIENKNNIRFNSRKDDQLENEKDGEDLKKDLELIHRMIETM